MSYPSLYRAKALSVQSGAITAFVPQVFGETTVTITDFLSAPVPGMGWVFFQAGNCEFPVWIGNSITVAPDDGDDGDGGGGVTVPTIPTTRLIATTPPLTGGGDLSADRTLAIDTFTPTVKGAVPPPTTATGRYLKDDGTWAVPAGSGTTVDEVWIGTDPPTGAQELWYDTDATSSFSVPPFVVKQTAPVASDFGTATIPLDAVWVKKP